MSRYLKGLVFPGIALLLATALVACGGDDDDDDATTNPGGGETTQQASPTTTSDDQGDDDDGGGPTLEGVESGSGTFTIDGKEFDADFVLRCEPFNPGDFGGEEVNENSFDFVAADNGGNVVQGEIVYREISSFGAGEGYTALYFNPFASRTGDSGIEQYEGSAVTAPDGTWYTSLIPEFVLQGQDPDGEPLAPPNGVEVDGNHIRGTLMGLQQSWPQDQSGTVDITIDLELPGEMIDCSTAN